LTAAPTDGNACRPTPHDAEDHAMPRSHETADERRAAKASTWIEELARAGRVGRPALVRDPSGRVHLLEGGSARPVPSGIIANGLEASLGSPRATDDHELGRLEVGPPVDAFEGPDGAAFVVIGGERRRLAGLPLTHRVSTAQATALPKGATIDVAHANVSRRRLNQALSWRSQLARGRAAVRRKGIVGSARSVTDRSVRALRKRSGR
jgi:hypothetical protein